MEKFEEDSALHALFLGFFLVFLGAVDCSLISEAFLLVCAACAIDGRLGKVKLLTVNVWDSIGSSSLTIPEYA